VIFLFFILYFFSIIVISREELTLHVDVNTIY